MLTLPRNSTSQSTKTKGSAQKKAGWKGLTLDELGDISQKIKEKFKWNHAPREFQLDAVKAQLLRKDVLIHAGTGSGKTFVAAGPHAHEATEGMVTFMVSPLIALQEEQVSSSEAVEIDEAHERIT
jgi:superfamily II DNA helicase RecQ